MQEGDEGRTRKIEILMRVVVGVTGLSLVGGERRRRDGGARGGDVGVLQWRGGGEGVGDVDGDLHSSSAGTLQLGIHSV